MDGELVAAESVARINVAVWLVYRGEQHCGERPHGDVRAGPQAKQEAQRVESAIDTVFEQFAAQSNVRGISETYDPYMTLGAIA
jgi:hypothetical protein